MTTQPNLKSAAITSLDAKPPVRVTAGAEGGPSFMYSVIGIAGPTTDAYTTGGVLRLVRLPSNAIIRKVSYIQKAATTTATFSFGIYYSDTTDGTSASNVAATATAIMSTLFGSSVDTHAATTWTDITFVNTSGFLPIDTVLPLWNATNSTLTSDPGGFIDICALNTATISGAAILCLKVEYCIAAQ